MNTTDETTIKWRDAAAQIGTLAPDYDATVTLYAVKGSPRPEVYPTQRAAIVAAQAMFPDEDTPRAAARLVPRVFREVRGES